MMDDSMNYNIDYTQESTHPSNDRMFGFVRPVETSSVPTLGMDRPLLMPVHHKIHINPSVFLSENRENNSRTQPISSHSRSSQRSDKSYSRSSQRSDTSYSRSSQRSDSSNSRSSKRSDTSHSRSSQRNDTRSSVRNNRDKRFKRSRNSKKPKRITDRRHINNNGSKISSRDLARLILKIHAEENCAKKNNEVDIDELMNRELTSTEKVKRTVDARLWLQAKTALKKANQIAKTRDQANKSENCKLIRLETYNKTFVNRGTSPIIFQSADIKTEVELLESDDDDYQIVEIDSKREAELLGDDDDNDYCEIINSSKL